MSRRSDTKATADGRHPAGPTCSCHGDSGRCRFTHPLGGITDAANGEDQLRVPRIRFELASQTGNVHINNPQVFAHTFCLEARALVNDEDNDTLGAAIEAKSVQCARSSWASSSEAGQAARMLTDVAIKCVKGATGRSTPAQVLAELEAAGRLAVAGKGDGRASGGVIRY